MYKEKAKLFRHNSVLIPLGDDFKYKNPDITRKVMTQYEKLFKYINSDPSLGVNVSFITLPLFVLYIAVHMNSSAITL
jgi:alpha-mannosidase II